MSSRWPMRLGRPLKNHTCEQGEASSMWPRRSRRTFGERDFHTAFVADHAAVLHALVLAAEALPIGYRTEDAGAEQSVALGFKGAIVNGLWLGDFAMRPAADFFRRCQTDADGIEIRDRVLHFERARTKQGVPPVPALSGAGRFSAALPVLCFAVVESFFPTKRF